MHFGVKKALIPMLRSSPSKCKCISRSEEDTFFWPAEGKVITRAALARRV